MHVSCFCCMVSVQFSSVAHSCPSLCDPMDHSTSGFLVHHQLLELTHWLMSTELVMPSNHLILCQPLSSRFQSFPASGSFQMSQLFASSGQSIGISASAAALPMNIQDWFPLGLAGLISLLFKGLSRVFSNTTVQQHHSLVLSYMHGPTLTSLHDYCKNHNFD